MDDFLGVDMAMAADTPASRKQAFRPADPLKDHVLASLAFLRRVDTVQLTGGCKKTVQFTVQLHADHESDTFRPPAFTIHRTAQEIGQLSKIVRDACCRHVELSQSVYHVPTCRLCEPFKAKVELPVSAKDRLFQSTQKIQSVLEARVIALVRGAVVPPTNPTLFCEGVTRFPAAVTKFLLTGVDQTTL